MKLPKLTAALSAALLGVLSGCSSSPPLHYHSLSGPATGTGSGNAEMLVEIVPLMIPERVNRDDIVIQGQNGGITILHDERWAAPLSDEVRQVIDDTLWQTVHAADVYQTPVAQNSQNLPLYRLAVRIEKFDTGLADSATVEASWTIRRLPMGQSTVCRSRFSTLFHERNVEGAVAALTESTALIAQNISTSLQRLQHGLAAPCAQNGADQ